MGKSLIDKLIFNLRNIQCNELFEVLEKYCHGNVLDIGGYDFFLYIRNNPKLNFKNWTNLEINKERLSEIDDPRYKVVFGDAENIQFQNNSFDTVLNIHVLEHTFNPTQMVHEIMRVLKSGGVGIFLIPQTALTHHPPPYYNFTKFYIRKVMSLVGLNIIEMKSIGGFWTTKASHLFYFFLQSFKVKNYSTFEEKRNSFFYLLWPFMALYALLSIPLCLLFGLGDLTE